MKRAFTLIELLVVLGILMILGSIVISGIKNGCSGDREYEKPVYTPVSYSGTN